MSSIKVGINGFGRIGRVLLREAFSSDSIEVVGINDTAALDLNAHLLKYDSIHGVWSQSVKACEKVIKVNDKDILISRTRNPEEIPWKKWGVDVVFDCTGAFKKKEDLEKHLKAGAQKVIVSAPVEGADHMVVMGVNETTYDNTKHHIVSNASCTTNCLAPLAHVLHETFSIEKGFMTTVHAVTNDQNILDAHHSDMRRARAAYTSMIPTTTGAARSVGKVLPQLKGKIDGLAVRVPTENVSLVDFVFESQKELNASHINQALQEASENSLKGILGFETQPLVSKDFLGRKESSVVDGASTMVIGDKMAKVLSWYDNEVGFSCRMVELAVSMFKRSI